jgi:hypothetical protein
MSQDKGFFDSKKMLQPNQNQPANDNVAMPPQALKTPWQNFCSNVLEGYAASKSIEDDVAQLFEGSYQLSKGQSNT